MSGEPWGGRRAGESVSCLCPFHLFLKELKELSTMRCNYLCNGQVGICSITLFSCWLRSSEMVLKQAECSCNASSNRREEGSLLTWADDLV